MRFLIALIAMCLAAAVSARPAAAETGGWVTVVQPSVTLPSAARTNPLPPASLNGKSHALDGVASYYWQDQMTASGERFDKLAMTAAHKTLPFGTQVKVTNLGNGRSTVVRINDRGPFKPGRVIDVSEAAATQLDMRGRGLAPVRIEVLGKPD